jgi:hypothetical protein
VTTGMPSSFRKRASDYVNRSPLMTQCSLCISMIPRLVCPWVSGPVGVFMPDSLWVWIEAARLRGAELDA